MAAARAFQHQKPPRRAAISALMAGLVSQNPYECRFAADLARRVSAYQPGVLRVYADVLIDLASELPLEQWQARGYVTLAAALNASTHAQRMKLSILVRALAEDQRNALRATALEAFTILALAEPALREEALMRMEQARVDGTAAMRSRARRMLDLLLGSVDPSERK